MVAHDWSNYAVITGSAAGALTGLLFVAVSVLRERIVAHPALRAQAGQTLVLFVLPLLLSLLLVIPGDANGTLGTALLALAAVATLVSTVIGRGKRPAGNGSDDRLALLINRVSPNLTVLLLIVVAGCLQLAGEDGLYWVAGSGAVCLVGGVINAWLFLTHSLRTGPHPLVTDGVAFVTVVARC